MLNNGINIISSSDRTEILICCSACQTVGARHRAAMELKSEMSQPLKGNSIEFSLFLDDSIDGTHTMSFGVVQWEVLHSVRIVQTSVDGNQTSEAFNASNSYLTDSTYTKGLWVCCLTPETLSDCSNAFNVFACTHVLHV